MRLLEPSLFYLWAPLVLVPILLYLFRPRPKTVRTSTLPFFKWLAREHQDSAWLKWLKHLLSLLLSILVIVGAAAALGRLVAAPPAEAPNTVVILVDRSASMAAEDSEGRRRLDEAVDAVQQRLAGLPAGIGVIVMAYDRRPEVLLSRSMDRRQVQRALTSIEVRPMEADPEAALRLARRLAGLEAPANIWHATDALPPTDPPVDATPDEVHAADGAADGATDEAEVVSTPADDEAGSDPSPDGPTDGVRVEHLCFALPEPVNVGITAFRLGRVPLERSRFEAFVQIHCTAPEPVEATLEVIVDGELVQTPKYTLPPGGRKRVALYVDARPDADRVLSLKVSAPGDVFAWDDTVHARVPRLKPVKALWISESPDPFTELALSSLGTDGDIEVLQGLPSAWPPEQEADVVILDG